MDQYSWILWVAAIVIFGIAEAATVNMISIWFVGGSLAALIADLLGANAWVQIAVFLVVSIALLATLMPYVRRHVSSKKVATNADMAIGREAYLTETVDNIRGTGSLKLDGKEWSVRSANGSILEKDMLVKIVKMEGVKLYVEPARTTVGV